jgi:hypothetical protein
MALAGESGSQVELLDLEKLEKESLVAGSI